MALNIVLVEPEIPANTGNIARTCGSVGARLHLVKPLGFSIDDKHVKRAGLDYWHFVDITVHEGLAAFLEYKKLNFPDIAMYYCTTKAAKRHTDVTFHDGDFLLFGKETKGLPEALIFSDYANAIRIPMLDDPEFRSLNLSNSVAVVIYEAMRQLGFPMMR
ncbi:MAG: tRNA (uridine(34)/cytosine(34)/5-carboxymethylaminomethyluridine(34)-2'-O)-methyltransferase TrmL [Clostridia bacterium]|nr:tRNA (uridine(34)/cytosine(34)/5-carboxymethylaminomethyluridine(34)-2'-O)-methyltransferase TrmL [Clostridia bacterium]